MADCHQCNEAALTRAVLIATDDKLVRLCERCGDEAIKSTTDRVGPTIVTAAMAVCERCGTRSLGGYAHVAMWAVGADVEVKPGRAGAQRRMHLLCPACARVLDHWLNQSG